MRDHKITKEQLERQNKMHEEYSEKLQDKLRNKLSELRTQYSIEKEQNRSKLQMVEIKYKNL